MAEASQETIQSLIENSEKGLAQIEMSSSLILETRLAVVDSIKKQEQDNVVLVLLLTVLDTSLAENEVTYDMSASLDALLKAANDYTKRFYMQSLNLCFVEACQVFEGKDGDEYGLLTRLENQTKQLNQAGCQFIARHIIDDIQSFRSEYCDKELRDITRHYDDPIKMFEKIRKLDSIEFFANGVSQLMAIRMEVSVLSSYLLTLLTPAKKKSQSVVSTNQCGFDLKAVMNDTVFKAFKKRHLKEEIQRTLDKGQTTLDECYKLHSQCQAAVNFLEERNCKIPDEFLKMESLIRLRMEVLFLRYDVACSVWGYLNAVSDKERSQNLRLIHIIKQAALTHIYGYNDKKREKSLWAKIKAIEETNNEMLNTDNVEKSLKELTSNLAEDRSNSNMFAHYRYQQEFYIPARLEAFGKMVHYKELADSVKLLNVCKSLETFTTNLLSCIDKTQKEERRKQYQEWVAKIDDLVAKMGNDDRAKVALRPMYDLISRVHN